MDKQKKERRRKRTNQLQSLRRRIKVLQELLKYEDDLVYKQLYNDELALKFQQLAVVKLYIA
jgi:hypothetical protein